MNDDDMRINSFHLPTRVRFGHGCVAAHGEEMVRYGGRVLLVTGGNSARISGALDEVCEVLDKAGIVRGHYDGITENPDWTQVRAACAAFDAMEAEFVIGIGGGSPLDAAKAVAILVRNGSWKDTEPNLDELGSACPIVAVPTTSGTGSEVTPHSVITDPVTRRKGGISSEAAFPSIAYVDPRYTESLPPNVTRDTAVDALSHLLEGLYSTRRNPLLYPLIYEGVALVHRHLPLCLDCPADTEARLQLSRASLMGGMVIAHTGTTLQHALSYPLTMELGLPHGLANGVVMRQVMELYFPVMEEQLNRLFRFLGITYGEFFHWLERLDMRVGKPITGEFLDRRVPEVLKARNLNNTPMQVTDTHVRRIFAQLK